MGQWRNGEKHGFGTVIEYGGTIYAGHWKEGVPTMEPISNISEKMEMKKAPVKLVEEKEEVVDSYRNSER